MIRFGRIVSFFLTLFLVVAPVKAKALQQGGSATVIKVVDGDTVILGSRIEGSSRLRLVGIQAPKLPLGRKDFKKWPFADEAKSVLEKMILGKRVTLKFGGRQLDRHGRLLAHLYTEDGDWVQGALLAAGMARVYSFSDNRALIPDMLTLERQARKNRYGIWADPFYAVRAVNRVDYLSGTFQLVEGVVYDAQTVRGKTYLNFTADWRSDFTISIDKRAAKIFAAAGVFPLAMKGRMVRVRGWLKKRNGPMIEASHPEQIEIVDQ